MTAASASVWLLDLGNTRLKLCPHILGSEVREGSVQALAHADADFGSQLERALDALPPAGTALFASVGPPAVAATVLAQLAARGVVARAVGVDAQRPGLALCYAQPQRFGVDRWLGLIGARRHAGAGMPLLVASCGTALTIDLLDAGGRHLGGVIAPSPQGMAEALRSRASHLPVAADPVASGFACDTAAAIAAGCNGAALGLLQRSLADARARLGACVPLLLSGGGGAPLAQALRGEVDGVSYHPWLVLDGLAQLAHERASLR